MSTLKKIWLLLFVWLVIKCLISSAQNETEQSNVIYLTWMSNTNWLVEVGDTRILIDGWITRIPRPQRPDLKNPETFHIPPVKPDVSSVQRVHEVINKDKRLDYIFSGHSHFDHSFDTAVWVKLTGAKIIGPKSTCLQAISQGIPDSLCTIVEGGETFHLGSGLSARVICWHHSGDPSTPFGRLLQTPMELNDVPKPDSVTGGLKPSPLDDFPNGGGARAYLFTLKNPEGKITWFYSNSGNAATFEKPVTNNAAFIQKYNIPLNNLIITPEERSVSENLISAKTEEGLDSLHLWIGYNNTKHVEQVISIIKPKVFIPQHWSGVWSGFFEGLITEYSNPTLNELLIKEGISLLSQQQYMDKYKLDMNGVTRVANEKLKEKLGF